MYGCEQRLAIDNGQTNVYYEFPCNYIITL